LGEWQATTPLPIELVNHTAIARGNYLYVIGGHANDDLSGVHMTAEVLYADIAPTGDVGPWLETTPLPFVRSRHASIHHNDHIYVIGGRIGWGAHGAVYRAEMHDNGEVDGWHFIGFLPVDLWGSAAAVYRDHLYVLGGFHFGAHDHVYYAELGEGRDSLEWHEGTSLPTAAAQATVEVYDGHLVVIGGFDAGDVHNSVYRAPIGPGGSVGEWEHLPSLPQSRTNHTSFFKGDTLCILGGCTEDLVDRGDTVCLDLNQHWP